MVLKGKLKIWPNGYLMKYAADNTSLPDKPNFKVIDEFLIGINERVVRGNI